MSKRQRETETETDGHRERPGSKILDSVCIFSVLIALVLLHEYVQEAVFVRDRCC